MSSRYAENLEKKCQGLSAIEARIVLYPILKKMWKNESRNTPSALRVAQGRLKPSSFYHLFSDMMGKSLPSFAFMDSILRDFKDNRSEYRVDIPLFLIQSLSSLHQRAANVDDKYHIKACLEKIWDVFLEDKDNPLLVSGIQKMSADLFLTGAVFSVPVLFKMILERHPENVAKNMRNNPSSDFPHSLEWNSEFGRTISIFAENEKTVLLSLQDNAWPTDCLSHGLECLLHKIATREHSPSTQRTASVRHVEKALLPFWDELSPFDQLQFHILATRASFETVLPVPSSFTKNVRRTALLYAFNNKAFGPEYEKGFDNIPDDTFHHVIVNGLFKARSNPLGPDDTLLFRENLVSQMSEKNFKALIKTSVGFTSMYFHLRDKKFESLPLILKHMPLSCQKEWVVSLHNAKDFMTPYKKRVIVKKVADCLSVDDLQGIVPGPDIEVWWRTYLVKRTQKTLQKNIKGKAQGAKSRKL